MQVQKIEEEFNNRNIKNMYRQIKKQTSRYQARLTICKDKDGNNISERGKILNRWKEYFDETLNNQTELNRITQNDMTIQYVENYIEPPTIDDTMKAITKLKNGKASGEDMITSELLKNGGHELHKRMHALVQKIWSNETLPTEWLNSVIVPVHKKGDKTNCSNYRGISLLSTGYKIFTNVLYDKMEKFAEEIIEDYQAGFRRNRSTIDQCFILNQIFENAHEFNLDIHCIFVDFKQAFDCIERSRIENTLLLLGIPKKLGRLACMTLEDTRGKVLVQGKISEAFNIYSGVKQGDALSTLIFNLMLQSIIGQFYQGGTINNKLVMMCAYADDIVIIARNQRALKDTYERLESLANNIGLKVNMEKTKYMVKSNSSGSAPDIDIGQYKFEAVTEFKYLGVNYHQDGNSTTAISERIQAASKALYAHGKLLRCRLLTSKMKLVIYATLIRPILTYGCEIWTLKANECNILRIFERKVLRKVYGPVRNEDDTYRIRYNHELEQLIEGRNIIRFIKAQRIRWLGHIIRMPEERAVQKILLGKPGGTRKRGRPRRKWITAVEDDLRKMGVNNYKQAALNRNRWRDVVEKALVHQEL